MNLGCHSILLFDLGLFLPNLPGNHNFLNVFIVSCDSAVCFCLFFPLHVFFLSPGN